MIEVLVHGTLVHARPFASLCSALTEVVVILAGVVVAGLSHHQSRGSGWHRGHQVVAVRHLPRAGVKPLLDHLTRRVVATAHAAQVCNGSGSTLSTAAERAEHSAQQAQVCNGSGGTLSTAGTGLYNYKDIGTETGGE